MKRFPMTGWWIALALILLLANIPLAVSAYGAWLADSNGCRISAGLLHECMIGGVDRGRDMQTLGMSYLYVFFTWPVGIVAFIVWLVMLNRRRGRWKKSEGIA